MRLFLALALAAAPLSPLVAASPQATEKAGDSRYSYADLADIAITAPVVAVATVRSVKRLKREAAAGVPPGHARLLIGASVTALIKGDRGVPAEIAYIFDAPLDSANRPPKLRKASVIVMAAAIADRPGVLRLTVPDGQLPWSAELEAGVRAILTAAVAPDAPPVITGIGDAFHVPGSLPGESETQIFLKTRNGRPVSLTVLRRPGEAPRWAVALGEMVDDFGRTPARDTLLWYRLACALPPALPQSSVASLSLEDAMAANADYRFVIGALGPCGRTRG